MLLTLSLALAADLPAAGSSPVVFPFRAVNLSAGEVLAAETLFRGWFERATGAPVYSDAASHALAAGSPDDAALLAACKSVSCQRYVVVELVRLDSNIIVRVVDHDASGAIRNDLDATADNLNDLHPLFDRVSRSLVAGSPIDASITRHNVLASETHPENRLATEKLVGFRFGMAVDDHGNTGLNTGFDMRWEMDHAYVEFDAAVVLPTGGEFMGLLVDIGGGYIPMDAQFSPYVGVGGGPRIFDYDGEGGVGLGAYAQAGAMFARASSFRPYVEVRAGADMVGDPMIAHPNVGVYAGIGF